MHRTRFAAIFTGIFCIFGLVISAYAFDFKKSYSAPIPKVSAPRVSAPRVNAPRVSTPSSPSSPSVGSSRPSSPSGGSSYGGSRSSSPSGSSGYGSGSRPANSAPAYNPGSGSPSPARGYSPPATSSGAKTGGPATMKFSTGGAKSTVSPASGSGSMKFSSGGSKSPAPAESKPGGSGSMKFSSSGSKSPASPETRPAAPATMKFSAGKSKTPPPAEVGPAGAGGMKLSAGGTKNAHPPKPVYNLPTDQKARSGNSTVLTKKNSESVVRQVNSARSKQRGVNARPLPQGQVTVLKDGGLNIASSGGRTFKTRADGTLSSFAAHGRTASFNSDGRVRALRTDKIEINRGPRGERRIHSVRTDKSLLVTTGKNRGYLQRSVARNGRTFTQRTSVEGNEIKTREYSPYSLNGVPLESYAPNARYAPAMYDWAGNPWGAQVGYQWGCSQEPWYGANNGYFTTLAAYQNPSQWLTDYMLAQTMQAAYQDPEDGNDPPQALYADIDSPISAETRQVMAQEIRYQLEQEKETALNASQQSGCGELPAVLSDPQYLFVVSSGLIVTTNGQGCGLTPGDILQLTGTPPEGAQTATLHVVSSKRLDCPANSIVTVSLGDLQGMYNNMREQIDAGLGRLRTGQGTPAPPRSAIAAPRPTEAADLPPVEGDVRAMLQSQQREADQAETEIIQTALAEDARKK